MFRPYSSRRHCRAHMKTHKVTIAKRTELHSVHNIHRINVEIKHQLQNVIHLFFLKITFTFKSTIFS